MKATPEDVAKGVVREFEILPEDASMKATPEDVAKLEAIVVDMKRIVASMKATPEDVAKPGCDPEALVRLIAPQ